MSETTAARLAPDVRAEQILEAASELYSHGGFHYMSGPEIARRLDVSRTLITHYYPSLGTLEKKILQRAVTEATERPKGRSMSIRTARILAFGLLLKRHPVKRVPLALKKIIVMSVL